MNLLQYALYVSTAPSNITQVIDSALWWKVGRGSCVGVSFLSVVYTHFLNILLLQYEGCGLIFTVLYECVHVTWTVKYFVRLIRLESFISH